MSKKVLSAFMLVMAWMAGGSAFAQHEHNYVNGICRTEGCARETGLYEAPEMDDEGYMLLRNAGNVEWFSWDVHDGNLTAKARLMNDIDFENEVNLHYPIGPNTGQKYNGIFDGQGHRIKNLILDRTDYRWINGNGNPEDKNTATGFFGFLRGNSSHTVVKNLYIDESCSFKGDLKVGALTGGSQNSGTSITLENIVVAARVEINEGTGTDAGGLIGSNLDGSPEWHITNCLNAGTIIGHGYAGALAGWMGNNGSAVIQNFINIGEVTGTDGTNQIARISGKANGLYELSENPEGTQGLDHDFTREDIANGKLAYILNGDQSNIVWRQTIGTDRYPLPFGDGAQVYFDGIIRCDGTPLEGTFTNTPSVPTIGSHKFEEGNHYCAECGQINPDYCPMVDDFYQLSTPDDLMWFAEMVNAGYGSINAVLTSDLDFAGFENEDYIFIGRQAHPYTGTFDGQFHTISNYVVESEESHVGVFGYINGGATIKNLRLDASCDIKGYNGVGMIGFCANAGNVLLENLGNEGNVHSATAGAGAILGCNTGSKAKIYMNMCYMTGNVTNDGIAENGLLSGWLGNNGAVVTNCWASGYCQNPQNSDKIIARHDNATFTNCYALEGTQVPLIDYEEIENGALCYKLNAAMEEPAWYQNIDKGEADEHPTFMPGHNQVYANAEKKCDGSFDPNDVTYSNYDNSTIPPHEYVDGFCKNCNHENPDHPFIHVFANADHDTAGGYTNVQSNDGSGLAINNSVAEHWNQHYFTSTQGIKGLQKGIYKLRLQGYSRVEQWGNSNAYEDGELNPDIAQLHHNSVYFVEKDGKMIANLFQDITTDRQEEQIGTANQNYSDVTGCYVPNSLAAANAYFRKGLYWCEPLYFAVESENDSINVGVHNNMYLYGNWTVWDTWRLEYVGDDAAAIELIRKQQLNNTQTLDQLEAQKSLVEGYEKAQADMKAASTLAEMLDAADVLSRNPELIRLSHLAYIKYDEAVKAIKEERDARTDLNGPYAELLDIYLQEDLANVEGLNNGTYEYIMNEKPLSVEQLEEEIAFVQQLYMAAVKNSISAGSDLSSLIVNPGFDEDKNWTGWTRKVIYQGPEGNNFECNSGFTDIYPVAGTWNTAFDVYQDMEEGLPNGFYEIVAPAFFRNGSEGMGEAEDITPAELYINDYYTPILNHIEGLLPYDQAINGVNCRYDAYDEEAPHAGEQTNSVDIDYGTGYIPGSGRYDYSFWFAGGNFVNHAYAIVTDGKLRIGIRNPETPWYSSCMTMWGRFQLKYMGAISEEAAEGMLKNYEKRLEKIRYANEYQDYFLYQGHITNLETLIAQAQSATGEAQVEALKKVNEEFNTVYTSNAIYNRIFSLTKYCDDKAYEYSETDPDLSNAFDLASQEIYDIVVAGELTDEEAEAFYENFLMREDLGGGYYVQGDLLDQEGNNIGYNNANQAYKMTKNAQGKYVTTITVQNRANQANSNARAGVYISALGHIYRCATANRNFVTPANTQFYVTENGGSDFQMVGGTFNVTFDPDKKTIEFEAVDYKWHDRVFVVGSVTDREGNKWNADKTATVRWKNNEMNGLPHCGNGVYEGTVKFFEDPNHPGFLAFTLFTARATTSLPQYAYSSERSNWTEGRVGNDSYNGELVSSELVIHEDEVYGDLVRGLDRQWWMAWDNEDETQVYTVTYDMNHNTMKIRKGNHTNAIEGVTATDKAVNGIYTITGVRVNKATKGIYIVDGQKVILK